MKVSRYVELLEDQLQTLLGVDKRGGLVVVSAGKLTREAQQTLAGYAPQLVEYFTSKVDRELHVGKLHDELASLGFVQLSNGAWTHPSGDDLGDAILTRIISSADAIEAKNARERRLRREQHAMGVQPDTLGTLEDVENLTQHDDGSLTWTQRRGRRYREPAPGVVRL